MVSTVFICVIVCCSRICFPKEYCDILLCPLFVICSSGTGKIQSFAFVSRIECDDAKGTGTLYSCAFSYRYSIPAV